MEFKKNYLIKLVIAVFVLPFFAFSNSFPNSNLIEISIDISPNVLNLNSNGIVVTVHTNIPFTEVLGSTCMLNGVEIDHWKSDNRGYFVAKFNMDDIKSLPLNIDSYNTFELTGESVNLGEFHGAQDILVINRVRKPNRVEF
jgi:hypothetical protein